MQPSVASSVRQQLVAPVQFTLTGIVISRHLLAFATPTPKDREFPSEEEILIWLLLEDHVGVLGLASEDKSVKGFMSATSSYGRRGTLDMLNQSCN